MSTRKVGAAPGTYWPARQTQLRDLGAACPRCTAELAYLAQTGVLLVTCPACGYNRSLAWDAAGTVTTHEQSQQG